MKGILVGVAMAAAMTSAGVAQAANVRVVSNEGTLNALIYAAAPGEVNNVVLQPGLGDGHVLASELGALVLTPGSGCLGLGLLLADCTPRSGPLTVRVTVGDGHDRVDLSRLQRGAPSIDLGAGNDVWLGGSSFASVAPGTGDDTVTAGSGRALVSYHDSHPGGVSVDLAGTSGGPGERDVLRGVVSVLGTAASDRFRGAAAGELFDGSGGIDDARGGAGDDDLRVLGGSAAGDEGNDFLGAIGAASLLDGGDGDDVLRSFGSAATLVCGAGNDTVYLIGSLAAQSPSVSPDCEQVFDHRT